MSNPNRTPKIIRVRWHAEQPPSPLGCRWCGHPPYAHDAASLPHRPGHLWEQPTPAQVRTRMTARRHLGLCGRLPSAVPPAPPVPPAPTVPTPPNPFTIVTARPTGRPFAGSPVGRGRHARPAAMAAPPYGQSPYGRESPGVRLWPGRRESYRKGVTA
ncbi:hypothetical protein [Streptosporangium sp. NBC_01469]|uniref:hypothetical protein n=1 Tax=Streptosporangium sp. NBC_01469 TaxID=2903898 RepID=UPI002E2BF5FD|nr:hypothetical protein [Streptosporangium sp. NBC_01469]